MRKISFLAVLILLVGVSAYPWPWAGGGGGGESGTGDMTKAVYDSGDDGQVDNAALADALSAQYIDWNSGSGGASIANKPTLGTAAAKDIPATGDASATEVVYGTDTRLTDARTPSAHTQSAATGGTAIDTSAATGIPYVAAGTWSTKTLAQFLAYFGVTFSPTDNSWIFPGTITFLEAVSSALDNTRGVTVPNTADPTGANLALGKCWFNITTNMFKCQNGDNSATLDIFTSGAAHTLNFATTGTLAGGIMILDNVVAPTAAQCYGSWNTITTAGTVTLPAAAPGMSTCIATEGALEITLELDGSDTFVLAGVTMDAGEAVINTTAEAAGDYICVIATSAAKWRVAGKQGTWTQATP